MWNKLEATSFSSSISFFLWLPTNFSVLLQSDLREREREREKASLLPSPPPRSYTPTPLTNVLCTCVSPAPHTHSYMHTYVANRLRTLSATVALRSDFLTRPVNTSDGESMSKSHFRQIKLQSEQIPCLTTAVMMAFIKNTFTGTAGEGLQLKWDWGFSFE